MYSFVPMYFFMNRRFVIPVVVLGIVADCCWAIDHILGVVAYVVVVICVVRSGYRVRRERRLAIVKALQSAIACGVLADSHPEYALECCDHVAEALRIVYGIKPRVDELDLAMSKIPLIGGIGQ